MDCENDEEENKNLGEMASSPPFTGNVNALKTGRREGLPGRGLTVDRTARRKREIGKLDNFVDFIKIWICVFSIREQYCMLNSQAFSNC